MLHMFCHSALRKGVFLVLLPKRASRSFSPIHRPAVQESKVKMTIGISAQVRCTPRVVYKRVCDERTAPSTGAGFYLNATNPKYARHYNMHTHIQLEIPQVLETAALPIVSNWHSLPIRAETAVGRRISRVCPFLATVWVAMERFVHTLHPRQDSTVLRLPSRPSQTPSMRRGDRKLFSDIFKVVLRKQRSNTTQRN